MIFPPIGFSAFAPGNLRRVAPSQLSGRKGEHREQGPASDLLCQGGTAGGAHSPLRVRDDLVGHHDRDAELRRRAAGARRQSGWRREGASGKGEEQGGAACLVGEALELPHEAPEVDLAGAELPSALVLGAVEGGGAVDDEAGEAGGQGARRAELAPAGPFDFPEQQLGPREASGGQGGAHRDSAIMPAAAMRSSDWCSVLNACHWSFGGCSGTSVEASLTRLHSTGA